MRVNGLWTKKEFISEEKEFGTYKSLDGVSVKTNNGIITYKNNGQCHLIPSRRKGSDCMKFEEINKLLGKNITIYLENSKNYSGYAREIVMPDEDDEIQEPILALEIDVRKDGTIDGFYIKDIVETKVI